MDNYLQHHGRLGQKWGKKNGPPYPLNYDDLSPEEREKAKKSAYDRGDIKEAYVNKRYFSNQEIDDIVIRFKKQNDLLSMIPPEIRKTGADKIKEISNTMSSMGDALNKAGNLIEGGTKAYNALAKVLNSMAGTNLKPIKDAESSNPYDTKKLEYLKKKEEYEQAKLKTKADQLKVDQTKWNQDRQEEKYDNDKKREEEVKKEQKKKEKEKKNREDEQRKKEEETNKRVSTSDTANNSRASSLSTPVKVPERRDTSKDNVRLTISDKPMDSAFERIPEKVSLVSNKNGSYLSSLLNTPVASLPSSAEKDTPKINWNEKAIKNLEDMINYGNTGKLNRK